MSVFDNFSISKNDIICAEATQGTMVSKLSVNVKPLHNPIHKTCTFLSEIIIIYNII
jgi:hypothetical protein